MALDYPPEYLSIGGDSSKLTSFELLSLTVMSTQGNAPPITLNEMAYTRLKEAMKKGEGGQGIGLSIPISAGLGPYLVIGIGVVVLIGYYVTREQ